MLSNCSAGNIVFALALTCIVSFSSLPAQAAEPLKAGFIYVGPVRDAGWTHAHNQGRLALEKKFGNQVETTYVENVPEGADAERVIRKLAANGNKLIFTTSFGFMNPTLKVARQYPDTYFYHATGYKTAPNVNIYEGRTYEGAYLNGILAGKMTKSNILGFVGSYPVPEVIRNINAFTLGARSINPKVVTRVVWINSWFDPGREKQAAETLIAQNADVLAQNTDSPAVVKTAEEKGVYAFGWDSDMRHFGPNAHLTATVLNWHVFYIHTVQQILSGKWDNEPVFWGFSEGLVAATPLNPTIPESVALLFGEKEQALIDGNLQPFAGPIKDQKGEIRVKEGEIMPHNEVKSIDWYVEGVKSTLPH